MYERAIELFPRNDVKCFWAHKNLGVALEKLGKHEEAESAYRKAIELDPQNADTQLNLGNSLHDKMRDYEGARSAFEEAISLYIRTRRRAPAR